MKTTTHAMPYVHAFLRSLHGEKVDGPIASLPVCAFFLLAHVLVTHAGIITTFDVLGDFSVAVDVHRHTWIP